MGPTPKEVLMNVVLWAAQLLAAAIFLFSAFTKGTWSKEKLLAKGQTGAAPIPLPLLRAIAFAELLGAIGLVAPWLTGIAPILTPLAATGLSIIMVGAAVTHLRLNEPRTALQNLAILALCVSTAVGRCAQLA
jgi:uncharacterized membrane protein YphA (DoxX/SURF4 family)